MEALTKALKFSTLIIRSIGNPILKGKGAKRTQFSKPMTRQWFLGIPARERGGTSRQIMHMLDL